MFHNYPPIKVSYLLRYCIETPNTNANHFLFDTNFFCTAVLFNFNIEPSQLTLSLRTINNFNIVKRTHTLPHYNTYRLTSYVYILVSLNRNNSFFFLFDGNHKRQLDAAISISLSRIIEIIKLKLDSLLGYNVRLVMSRYSLNTHVFFIL